MVFVLLADGFEELEGLIPLDYLRRAGLEVYSVGVTGSHVVGAHDIPVVTDIVIAQVQTERLEMIVLPGGLYGTRNLEKHAMVQGLISYCIKQDIPIGAICAAPSILGNKGLLRGKRATCYPGFEGMLHGAQLAEDKVVTDGNIITAKGVGVAQEFSFALIEKLCGAQTADQVKEQVCYE